MTGHLPAWAGRHQPPAAAAEGGVLALPGSPGAGRVGLRLWSGAEASEGKADVMGMYLMGGCLGVSCWIAQLLLCRG